jgi:hypothetical protein
MVVQPEHPVDRVIGMFEGILSSMPSPFKATVK